MESDNIDSILERIVNHSINQVVCIDDDLVLPYFDEENKPGQKEFSKNLFNGISETCGCYVDIVPFTNNLNDEKLEKSFKRKDLLVLDWELSRSGVKYKRTLEILNKALQCNIPFICIYTHGNDINNICDAILNYFSGYSGSEAQIITGKLEDAGIIKEEFIDDVKKCIQDRTYDMANLIQKVEQCCKDIKTINIKYRSQKEWFPVYINWTDSILPEKKTFTAKKVNGIESIINIEGKIVVCYSKNKTEGNDIDGINPEEIIPTLAKSIIKAPNTVFDVIWMHYSNNMMDVLDYKTEFLKGISDEAFYYYSNKLLNQGKIDFESFLQNAYRDGLIDRMDSERIQIPDIIAKELQDRSQAVNENTIKKELIKLNEHLSINKSYSRVPHMISFGDLFFVGEDNVDMCQFWLCITAKCDCVRPEKIRNNYIFIGGRKCTEKNALEDAEKKLVSFVNFRDEYIPIEWCTKISSIYFPEATNVVNGIRTELNGNYKGKDYKFEYVCNVKENYTQRMANQAFSDGNRVGISLAHIDKVK